MNVIRNIAVNIFLLGLSILLLGFNTVKQIVLPTHKRKGNLLSLIFSFLTDVTEEVLVFESSILSRSWILQQKFIKRGLVIGAAFFFLLSSFEWMAPYQQPVYSAGVETVQAIQKKNLTETKNYTDNFFVFINTAQGFINSKAHLIVQKYPDHLIPLPQKRYLMNRSFLI